MQLGWIDFSKEDRQKAFDVINLLSEQGAVDELGIGVIRDAFANYFFPGTSTIQTRAKYFLIVPYMLIDYSWGEIDFVTKPLNEMRLMECTECEMSAPGAYDIDIEADDINVTDTATVIWEIA